MARAKTRSQRNSGGRTLAVSAAFHNGKSTASRNRHNIAGAGLAPGMPGRLPTSGTDIIILTYPIFIEPAMIFVIVSVRTPSRMATSGIMNALMPDGGSDSFPRIEENGDNVVNRNFSSTIHGIEDVHCRRIGAFNYAAPDYRILFTIHGVRRKTGAGLSRRAASPAARNVNKEGNFL